MHITRGKQQYQRSENNSMLTRYQTIILSER